MNLYIGIDPGLDGALAVLDESGAVVSVVDMPTISLVKKGKKSKSGKPLHKRQPMHVVMAEIVKDAKERGNVVVAGMELVSSMPKQGVTSMFSMGRGVGSWEGIVAALDLPIDYITPQSWKKSFGLLGTDKNASILKAQQSIKGAAGYLTLVKHDGRAEAILIAEYTRRKALGILPVATPTPKVKKVKPAPADSPCQGLAKIDAIIKQAAAEELDVVENFFV